MKYWMLLITGLAALILWTSEPYWAIAGGVEEIKDETQEAVSEVKDEAVRAGKAAAETGKEIKDGAVKTGAAIKEGVKEVGRDVKNAYQETRDAVAREFSGDTGEPSGH
jgi:hypothetical protein